MSAIRNDERYKVFIERLPLNKYNVKKTAEEAGFAPSFARTQQKTIMRNAMRFQLERAGVEVKDIKPMDTATAKVTMAEILGFTRQELLDNVKYLATQEKDMSVRLRVVAPLAKEYGVDLAPEQTSGQLPALNITVTQRGSTQPQEGCRTISIVGHPLVDAEAVAVDGGVGEAPDAPPQVSPPTPSP